FSVEAAEAVIDLSPGAGAEGAPWVVDALHSLCDKSLLYRYEPREMPGELRLGLFASIREYAATKLEEGDAAAARERHARHCPGLCAQAEPRLESAEAPALRARLDLDRENLLEIHGRGVSAGTAQGALHALLAARTLSALMDQRGPNSLRLSVLDA